MTPSENRRPAGTTAATTLYRCPECSELFAPQAAHQLDILERMGVEHLDDLPDADVAIDAVIGYSLRGAPRGRSLGLIEAISRFPTVVSLDTPSGLEVTSGATLGAVVTADATLTLALPKRGLKRSPFVGDLYLADISVPPAVTAGFGRRPPRFGSRGLLRVVDTVGPS